MPLLGAAASAIGGPLLLSGCQDDQEKAGASDLGAYKSADINWKKADGTTINVGLIAATYFTNLKTVLPQFQELTGITVEAEEIPPQKIRENVVRDLSTKTGRYHTHCADPMYYPLYAANRWVEPLDHYLDNEELTNADWFDVDDIFKTWIASNTVDDTLYGVPYDGETTVQVYRKDLFEKAGLKAAQTTEEFRSNAEKLSDPDHRMWGPALRGLPGAGQNMYIYPSLFREWGASWFDDDDQPTVNSPEAVEALEYYVDLDTKYAPTAVSNWNWPDIADAFARNTLATYIDAHSSASVLVDKTKSQVVDKLAFERWPAGPSGKRCTSIWNWGFPINASIDDKTKEAVWLFIQWATCKETQIRTSTDYTEGPKRSGVNRESVWKTPEYAKAVSAGDNFINAALTSLKEDTDIDWRPRVPQWPAIGDKCATLVQSALTKQLTPKAALDQAQAAVVKIMKGDG